MTGRWPGKAQDKTGGCFLTGCGFFFACVALAIFAIFRLDASPGDCKAKCLGTCWTSGANRTEVCAGAGAECKRQCAAEGCVEEQSCQACVARAHDGYLACWSAACADDCVKKVGVSLAEQRRAACVQRGRCAELAREEVAAVKACKKACPEEAQGAPHGPAEYLLHPLVAPAWSHGNYGVAVMLPSLATLLVPVLAGTCCGVYEERLRRPRLPEDLRASTIASFIFWTLGVCALSGSLGAAIWATAKVSKAMHGYRPGAPKPLVVTFASGQVMALATVAALLGLLLLLASRCSVTKEPYDEKAEDREPLAEKA